MTFAEWWKVQRYFSGHRAVCEVAYESGAASTATALAAAEARIEKLRAAHLEVSSVALEQTARLSLMCGERDAALTALKRAADHLETAADIIRDEADGDKDDDADEREFIDELRALAGSTTGGTP